MWVSDLQQPTLFSPSTYPSRLLPSSWSESWSCLEKDLFPLFFILYLHFLSTFLNPTDSWNGFEKHSCRDDEEVSYVNFKAPQTSVWGCLATHLSGLLCGREKRKQFCIRSSWDGFRKWKNPLLKVRHGPCLSSLAHSVRFTHDERKILSFDDWDLIQT